MIEERDIIYIDHELLICRKRAGMATQTAKLGEPDLVSELKTYLSRQTGERDPYLGLVHRLDQPVEGLLAFGLTKRSTASLSKGLTQKEYCKDYYAVTLNRQEGQVGMLEDYLVKDGKTSTAKVVTADTPEAKKAVLRYRMVNVDKECALYAIMLETGRFHQIRVQMAHTGLPLLGDRKYGDEESIRYSEEHGIKNVALCAFKISLPHPVSGKRLVFTIEPEGKIFERLLGNKKA